MTLGSSPCDIDVLILFEHVARELKSAIKIAKILSEQYSLSCKVGSIYVHYYEMLRYKPKVLVLPWLYDDHDAKSSVRPFMKQNPNLKVFNLCHEQIGNALSKRFLFQRPLQVNNIYYVAWSKVLAEELKKIGVKTEHIFITGSPRFDFIFEKGNITKKDLAIKFNLAPTKKWVLFLDNFFKTNRQALATLKKRGYDAYKFLNISNQSKEAIIKILNGLAERYKSSLELIYRPHPGKDNAIAGLHPNIKIVSKHPVDEWLKHVDIVLGWTSTALMESIAVGKPTLRIVPITIPSDLAIEVLNSIPSAKELEEVTSYIDYSNRNDEKCSHALRACYYDYFTCTACEKIACAIHYVLNQGQCISTSMPSSPAVKNLLDAARKVKGKIVSIIGDNLAERNLIEYCRFLKILRFPAVYYDYNTFGNEYVSQKKIDALISKGSFSRKEFELSESSAGMFVKEKGSNRR